MDDESIVRLFWERDDRAIAAASEKYGRYCKAVARNILSSDGDAEECVNDAYLAAWNSMPDHRPQRLSAYLGKLTRNAAFNRYRRERAEKRGGGETALILDELAECVSDDDTVEREVERKELARAISDFVRQLPEAKRFVFVRRYWYADAIADIARARGVSEGAVAKTLERTRKQLRRFLTERGFEL